MSRFATLTIVCDNCGKLSEHWMLSSSIEGQTYTMQPYPKDWKSVKQIGGGDLTPVLDYCPTCKPCPTCEEPHDDGKRRRRRSVPPDERTTADDGAAAVRTATQGPSDPAVARFAG